MKKITKKMVAFIMAVTLFASSALGAAAAETEEYLSELRIVYADNKAEAEEIVEESFPNEGYKVYDYNLNKKTGKQAVWLAYKTTTYIEDAITDLAVMPMGGGYELGNYEETIKASREEYEHMASIYVNAIDYFVQAYEAGDFLAEAAYRQLNFYSDKEDHGGELLGDLFLKGLDAQELATMFMQGNVYALDNIRALIAMGVSYNEDGSHYLENVSKQAAAMEQQGAELFEAEEDFEEYESYANIIAATIDGFGNMFGELETVEDELNYEDENVTDLEMKYLSNMAMAKLTREVSYLNGQTLYEFCKSYEYDEEDLTSIYPLVAALNKGQKSMVQLGLYFEVLRYSVDTLPEEEMDGEIAELEAVYSEMPFDIYEGVDRSIYTGSFALTSEAYRGDLASETDLLDGLYNSDTVVWRILDHAAGAIGVGSLIWAVTRTIKSRSHYTRTIDNLKNSLGNSGLFELPVDDPDGLIGFGSYGDYVDDALASLDINVPAGTKFLDKVSMLENASGNLQGEALSTYQRFTQELAEDIDKVYSDYHTVYPKGYYNSIGTGVLYGISGVMMIYSAISLIVSVHNYKHPEYEDIPASLVDLIDTEDGDRFIKYDAVYEAENPEDIGDLNAFAAERWNALYYTKSYEAGKPLLAEFSVSTNNNVPKENCLGVHRFGEVICYNLNKFNFDSDYEDIYLSVAQSENQKSAVSDVPEVIGTMISSRYFALSACLGCFAGVAGMAGLQAFEKKKKRQ